MLSSGHHCPCGRSSFGTSEIHLRSKGLWGVKGRDSALEYEGVAWIGLCLECDCTLRSDSETSDVLSFSLKPLDERLRHATAHTRQLSLQSINSSSAKSSTAYTVPKPKANPPARSRHRVPDGRRAGHFTWVRVKEFILSYHNAIIRIHGKTTWFPHPT